MSRVGDFLKKIRDKVAEKAAEHIKAGIVAGVLGMIGAGWSYIWTHVNPQFTYRAPAASVSSGFVGLAQVLNQIEKDSHRYCSGGLDERLGKIGLRRCYHFTFKPNAIYQTMVCSHDQRSADITTSDQLAALRYFEARYAPLECLKAIDKGGDAFDIAQGKDTQFRDIEFSTGARQTTAFCGCSPDDLTEIAQTIGGKIP